MKNIFILITVILTLFLFGCTAMVENDPTLERDSDQYVPPTVYKQIDNKWPKITEIYETQCEKDGKKYRGKIEMRFAIKPEGDVVAVHAVSNTTGSPELEEALCDFIRRWKFKGLEFMGHPVHVLHPFEFAPEQKEE